MKNRFNKIFDIGIIGLGSTGKEHLKFYLKNKRVKNIYLSEIKKIKKNQSYNIDKNLLSFKKSKIKKILSISSYDDSHAKLILENYKSCNIFVEKPLCRTFSDLRKIQKLTKKNNYKNLIYSNLVLRSSKILNSILKQIRSGQFGTIYYFEGDYLYGRIKKLKNGWRGKDKNYSVVLGGGVHLIDLMISFFNQLPLSVSSFSNKFATKNTQFKNQDFVQSNFFFKNGAIAKITSNFGCVHKHQHVLKIYGTKKTFIYDDMGIRIFKNYDPAKSKKIKAGKLYSGKDAMLPIIFSILQNKNNFKKEINRELNLMSATVHADLSLKLKRKIKIKY